MQILRVNACAHPLLTVSVDASISQGVAQGLYESGGSELPIQAALPSQRAVYEAGGSE